MIYIKPRSIEKEVELHTKTFSYSQVEDMLYELVMCIDNLDIMHENNIMLTPVMRPNDRGIDVFVKQGQQVHSLFYSMEGK
jgi:hypothetical protein